MPTHLQVLIRGANDFIKSADSGGSSALQRRRAVRTGPLNAMKDIGGVLGSQINFMNPMVTSMLGAGTHALSGVARRIAAPQPKTRAGSIRSTAMNAVPSIGPGAISGVMRNGALPTGITAPVQGITQQFARMLPRTVVNQLRSAGKIPSR